MVGNPIDFHGIICREGKVIRIAERILYEERKTIL